MSILPIKNTIILFIALSFLGKVGFLHAQDARSIKLTNKAKASIIDCIVEIPVEELKLSIGNYKITKDSDDVAPLELITDIWGKQQALFLVPEVKEKSSVLFNIEKGNLSNYPKRTYAELSHKTGGQFIGKEYIGGYSWVKTNSLTLSGSFTDHSYFIKYEGPGWESDRVAFRFYLDNRNAIDVFAKTTSDLVLAGVGMDGFDSYHKLASWGMDNLKVGKALGLGSIATWDGVKATRVEKKDSTTCVIAADGKLRSQVKTTYYGWKTNATKCNLTSLISIDAGSRASHIELLTDKPIDNIATGIIKLDQGKLFVHNEKDAEWSYIATFGKQSLNKDMQGLVVFARTKQIRKITNDELNHLLVLQPNDANYVDYYIMSTWELDKEPVKTEEDFMNCINEQLLKLSNNIIYKIK